MYVESKQWNNLEAASPSSKAREKRMGCADSSVWLVVCLFPVFWLVGCINFACGGAFVVKTWGL
jgi:hypothetical protein